jgi:hypothetical protein
VNLSRVRTGTLLAACLAGLANGAVAQSSSRPELVFTISVGEAIGGHLWTVGAQPVLSVGGIDTVGLGRRLLRPSLVAGFGAQLYLSPHIGYTVEASFLGLATASQCTPPAAFAYDPERLNQQACASIQNKRVYTNAVALQGGLTARTTAGRGVQGYLRAVGGVAVLGGSFVTTAGAVLASDTSVTGVLSDEFLSEKSSPSLTWVATLGGGLTMTLGRSYNVRFEMSEVFIALPVPTGPGQAGSTIAPTGWRTLHLPTLTVGLDVLLERRSVRRY